MGGLITRARARRRATRRLRESAYAYSRYLLVSHPRVASYFSSLATYLRCTTYAVMVYSTKLSKEKHWDFHSGPGLAAATYLFFDFLLQAKRSVAGERMQRDCSSSQPSRSMAQGRQAHARAEAALPLAHVPRWWHQQRAEIELVQLCVLRSREEMRVSLRSRDAVRGAVGKYQPLFVIRHFRDGSASRVTGLRRCMLTGLNRATPPLVSGSHK